MARPRKLTPTEEQTIYEMKLEGVSETEIAYKHDISTRTVNRIANRVGEEEGNYYYRHEDRLADLLERDGTSERDLERKSLFYILSGNLDLYGKVDYIYDFKTNSIKSDCFENEAIDFCSSSCNLIKLAYNLYNGYKADVLETFAGLDQDNFNLAMEAIKIRLNMKDYNLMYVK